MFPIKKHEFCKLVNRGILIACWLSALCLFITWVIWSKGGQRPGLPYFLQRMY